MTEQTAKFSPIGHQLDVTQLQRDQTETKAMLVEPPAQEQEFDDLVYTLQKKHFRGRRGERLGQEPQARHHNQGFCQAPDVDPRHAPLSASRSVTTVHACVPGAGGL